MERCVPEYNHKNTQCLDLTRFSKLCNSAVLLVSLKLVPKGVVMSDETDRLIVLWASGDREVALKMVFMYTFNAKDRGWWKDITLIVWGPSAKLLSEDETLKDYIVKMKKAGVELEACKACADMYGVSEELERLGIDVKYMGTAFTEYLKSKNRIITL